MSTKTKKLSGFPNEIPYDNDTSGLTANNIQGAIDEVVDTKVGKTSDTGSAIIPVGTTAQRPANPEAGMIRFNTDESYIEWYDDVGEVWYPTSSFPGVVASGGTVTEITQNDIQYRVHTFTSDGTFDVTRGGEVEYLVVAGGGGGGAGNPNPWGIGGGGAGGFVDGAFTVAQNTFGVVVGDGGATQTTANAKGNPGSNSSVFGVVALGGGGGQGGINTNNRDDGGSGGGGATSGGAGLQPGSASGGFGNNGGSAFNSNPYNGGGGGGANAAGQNGISNRGGDGGAGRPSSITGTAVTYAGGGGGGGNNNAGGAGGAGGGGAGNNSSGNGFPGTANTGGGGGGGGRSPLNGGAGGSGIVIVRYRIG